MANATIATNATSTTILMISYIAGEPPPLLCAHTEESAVSRLFSHKFVRLSTGYFKETLIFFIVSFLLLFSGKDPVLPPAFLHF